LPEIGSSPYIYLQSVRVMRLYRLFSFLISIALFVSCGTGKNSFLDRKYLDLKSKSVYGETTLQPIQTANAQDDSRNATTSNEQYGQTIVSELTCDSIYFRDGLARVARIEKVTEKEVVYTPCNGGIEKIITPVTNIKRLLFANGDFILYSEPEAIVAANAIYGNFDDNLFRQNFAEKRKLRKEQVKKYPKGTDARLMSDYKHRFNSWLGLAGGFWLLSAICFIVSMIFLAGISWEVSLFLSFFAIGAVLLGMIAGLISTGFTEKRAANKIKNR